MLYLSCAVITAVGLLNYIHKSKLDITTTENKFCYHFITRTIDALIVAYDEQAFPCFVGDLKDTMDAVSNTK
jgi:hypothetical protein